MRIDGPCRSPLAEIGLLLYGPGNQSSLAAALGISLSTLQRMMRQGGQESSYAAGGLVIERRIQDQTQTLRADHRETLLRLLRRKRDQIDELVWMLTLDKVERELDSELEEDKEGEEGKSNPGRESA